MKFNKMAEVLEKIKGMFKKKDKEAEAPKEEMKQEEILKEKPKQRRRKKKAE